MNSATQSGTRFRDALLVGLLIATATFLLYLPVRTHQFLTIDDADYVVANEHINSGLSFANLVWAFTHFHAGNWHPLTWISHSLDCQLFGLSPGAHHLVNAGFHALNSLLSLLLLARLTGALWRSALVAGLFALHPLHVESVAWVAERKDVLSAFFFFLTLLAYTRYAEKCGIRNPKSEVEERERERRTSNVQRPMSNVELPDAARSGSTLDVGRWMLDVRLRSAAIWYLWALLLFALGLMSKPMLVTLPFVLVLLDFWPLRRFQISNFKFQISKFGDGSTVAPSAETLHHAPRPTFHASRPRLLRLLLEKAPFLALSTASSLLTFLAQQRSGAVVSTLELSVPLRLAHALIGYVRYLKMAFVPTGLSIFYPLPKSLAAWQVIGAAVILAAITVLSVATARKRPWLLFGWLWYLGMLLPVIGLVKAGTQAVADRYTYLPLIGIFVAVAWGMKVPGSEFQVSSSEEEPKVQGRSETEPAPRNTQYATRKSEPPYVGCYGLGVWCLVLLAMGLQTHRQLAYWQDSRTLAQHAVAVTRDNFFALTVLGTVSWKEGNLEEAKGHFLDALKYAPHSPDLHQSVGSILVAQTRYAEAQPHFEQALAFSPEFEEACYGQALCLFHQGQFADAESACRRAWGLKPEDAKAGLLLALVLQQSQQKTSEAETIYRQVLEDSDTANQARRLVDPAQAQAHCSYAQLLSSLGRPTDAIAEYRAALRLQPDLTLALNNLAWILASSRDAGLRDGPQAVKLAETACRLAQESEPVFVGTLAAAYAEAGGFDDAVKAAEKAQALAQKAGLPELAARNAALLELYRKREAYHEP